LPAASRALSATGKLNLEGLNVKVKAKVEHYDFSAHAGREELFRAMKKLNPEKVVCVHGDAEVTQKFAKDIKKEGFDCVMDEVILFIQARVNYCPVLLKVCGSIRTFDLFVKTQRDAAALVLHFKNPDFSLFS